MTYDRPYSNRLASAVHQAVLSTSRGEAEAPLVHAEEAFDALMVVAALLIAGDPRFDRPGYDATFAQGAMNKLIHLIATIRSDPARMAELRRSIRSGDLN